MSENQTGGDLNNLSDLLSPRFFKALSDPNRVAIIRLLSSTCQPMTVNQVADSLPVDVSVVSRHLALLRDEGIVLARKRGREVCYTINSANVARVLRSLADAFEACSRN